MNTIISIITQINHHLICKITANTFISSNWANYLLDPVRLIDRDHYSFTFYQILPQTKQRLTSPDSIHWSSGALSDVFTFIIRHVNLYEDDLAPCTRSSNYVGQTQRALLRPHICENSILCTLPKPTDNTFLFLKQNKHVKIVWYHLGLSQILSGIFFKRLPEWVIADLWNMLLFFKYEKKLNRFNQLKISELVTIFLLRRIIFQHCFFILILQQTCKNFNFFF